ncbi:MAG: hypothetical protein ACYSWU_21020 [Planctomycetota bacterium]|jgi:hypothetical protein
MSPLALLFADVGDLIKVLLAILFVIVPVIWGILSKLGKQQPQRPGGRRPPARPPGGAAAGRPPGGAAAGRPPGAAAAGRPPGGGLEDEIGEFLRRAAQHRQGQPPPGPRPGAPPAVGQPAGQQVVEAQVVGQPAIGEGIKQQVGEYLDAGEFRRRAAELGEEVAESDEQLEQRLHAKFDHEVSTLARRPGESAGAPRVAPAEEAEGGVAELPSTAAAGLAAMLSNPVSIRQAIVISEIINRPEQRWT